MAKGYKRQDIKIEILNDQVVTIFYYTDEKYKIDHADAYVRLDDNLIYGPAIYFDIRSPLRISSVIHELVHAATWILGDKIDQRSIGKSEDEILPYLMGFLSGRVFKYCQKNKIKVSEE